MLPVIVGMYFWFLDCLSMNVAFWPAVQASVETMPLMNSQAASRLSAFTPLGIANAPPVTVVSGSLEFRLRGGSTVNAKFGPGSASTPSSHCSKIVIAVCPMRNGLFGEKKSCVCENAARAFSPPCFLTASRAQVNASTALASVYWAFEPSELKRSPPLAQVQ